MFQFEIGKDGLLRETSIRRMVETLKQYFPDTDEVALEAHLMLELTHGVLADQRAASWTKLGLTGRRFTLLRLLYLAEQRRLSMGEIATNLNMGSNNTTQLIDGLVRDGLVQRETAQDDKRVVFAVLTQKGARLFAAAFPQNSFRVAQAWSVLSEREKRVLTHLMARLRVHLLSTEAGGALLEQVAAEDEAPADFPRSVTSLSQPSG